MYTILVTKMADHHAPLFPLWLWWYTHVNPVNHIRLTALKTPRTEIAKTVAFFKDRKVPGVKITVVEQEKPYFSEDDWWYDAMMAAARLEPLRPFTVIMADADEFYEPVPQSVQTEMGVYREQRPLVYNNWVLVSHDGVPLPEEASTVPFRSLGAFPWNPYKAVFLNTTWVETVLPGAHFRSDLIFAPMLPSLPYLFHLAYTGVGMFLDKVDAIALPEGEKDWHWPEYVKLREHGEDWLVGQYHGETRDAKPDLVAEAFKRYFLPARQAGIVKAADPAQLT